MNLLGLYAQKWDLAQRGQFTVAGQRRILTVFTISSTYSAKAGRVWRCIGQQSKDFLASHKVMRSEGELPKWVMG